MKSKYPLHKKKLIYKENEVTTRIKEKKMNR